MITIELIELARKQNRSALTSLYNASSLCSKKFLTSKYHASMSAGDIDELCHNSASKAILKLDSYHESKGKYVTWLYNITKNLAIDKFRSKSYKKDALSYSIEVTTHAEEEEENEQLSYTDILVSNTPTPYDTLVNMQYAKYLTLIVKSEPNLAKIATLSYIKELTYKEIADELNIPLGTVKANLHRFRSKVKHLQKVALN